MHKLEFLSIYICSFITRLEYIVTLCCVQKGTEIVVIWQHFGPCSVC